MNIEVVCINDKNRPNEVPLSRWIKEGKTYHIVEITKLNAQKGIYGCKLEEINNDDLFPYQYFRLDRFAVTMNEELFEKILEEIDISEAEEILQPNPQPPSKHS
ncbi:hypothetical protein AAG747_15100 [Rapidithrix thailandica]|uniref:Uncharacterized protein n=1 Tax=Rapidithrix thailandica TaxID=413964 RepID=A0AAW9S234_9BACT